MTLGLAPKQGDLLRTTVGYCEAWVGAGSIYAVLNRGVFSASWHLRLVLVSPLRRTRAG